MAVNSEFFRTLHDSDSELEAGEFLVEIKNRFASGQVHEEARWRLQVLKELTSAEGMEAASHGLRKQLSKIFATVTDEGEILAKLKDLTEVAGAEGATVDLRRFVKRDKRTLTEDEYRKNLAKKINNTSSQIKNLTVFFPDAHGELTKLGDTMEKMGENLHDPTTSIQEIRAREEDLRESSAFQRYEKLKQEFLRQWLGRFANLSEDEVNMLDAEEIQKLIVEHQRHQMTHLLKTEIKQSTTDMLDHLEPHDTLETTFADAVFWKGANIGVKNGFKDWIMGAIQAYGMLKGQRYAFFENEKESDHFLLFGIGVGEIGGEKELVEMVPFAKPFTRKAGYLLEIRKRDISDPDEYHAELRHYLMPFLFAFDSMRDFKLNGELLSFFTSNY